jgi:Cu(I)/Ag(I) efflux system membrane fusion protein/cobalt-zinc-cadmium efflux system membrane fusion protein
MTISNKRIGIALALAATLTTVAFAVGRYAMDPDRGHQHAAEEVWSCPMHPEVRQNGPGKCPKCGMDLVKETPATLKGAAPGAPETDVPRAGVQLDTRRRQLLGVRTARVERGAIARDIRAVGIVRYDETRLSDVNLKLDGWIEKLHVEATGQAVRRGQPLLDLYSPELMATQNEYLLALSTRETMQQSTIADARIQADRLVESARRRLTLWDLPADMLQRLEQTRKADANVTFRSPVSGFVIDKPVVEGMRVTAGQTLYKIADLSAVWVEADVFESDAPFIKVGAPAAVTLDAWPGESRRGRSVYIYPFVEEKTRTLRVRFAFANPDLRLKPGMYANVEMSSSLGNGLTVPSDAVLDAGRGQIVFVAEGDGYFEPRTVSVGQRIDGRVQILTGLKEGDEVATGAAFFLDSESQLRAAAGGWDSLASPSSPDAPAAGVSVTFTTEPSPPRSGDNTYDVRLTGSDGTAIADAQVKVTLYMPPMPSMNMPAMTSDATLTHVGGGLYRGTGNVSMAGRWDVTIAVTRDGRRLASKQTTLVAR